MVPAVLNLYVNKPFVGGSGTYKRLKLSAQEPDYAQKRRRRGFPHCQDEGRFPYSRDEGRTSAGPTLHSTQNVDHKGFYKARIFPSTSNKRNDRISPVTILSRPSTTIIHTTNLSAGDSARLRKYITTVSIRLSRGTAIAHSFSLSSSLNPRVCQ